MEHLMKTDEKLIKEFELGNHTAFRELILKHLSKAHHQFSNIANNNDSDSRLTQKILDSFFSQIEFMISSREFRKFMTRTVGQACIRHLRENEEEHLSKLQKTEDYFQVSA